MGATLEWVEYTGATTTGTPTNLNMGSTSAINLNPSTYPISVGNYSYEKWLKAKFTGTFTTIHNIKFWKSSGTYITGELVNFGMSTTFANPTTSGSTFATASVATASANNVTISGTTSSTLTPTQNTTDYIVLQASISSFCSQGSVNTKTFTISYDET